MKVKLLKKVRKHYSLTKFPFGWRLTMPGLVLKRSYMPSENEQHAFLVMLMLMESLGYARYLKLVERRAYRRYLRRNCTPKKDKVVCVE